LYVRHGARRHLAIPKGRGLVYAYENQLYSQVKTEGRTKYLKRSKLGCDGAAKVVNDLFFWRYVPSRPTPGEARLPFHLVPRFTRAPQQRTGRRLFERGTRSITSFSLVLIDLHRVRASQRTTSVSPGVRRRRPFIYCSVIGQSVETFDDARSSVGHRLTTTEKKSAITSAASSSLRTRHDDTVIDLYTVYVCTGIVATDNQNFPLRGENSHFDGSQTYRSRVTF